MAIISVCNTFHQGAWEDRQSPEVKTRSKKLPENGKKSLRFSDHKIPSISPILNPSTPGKSRDNLPTGVLRFCDHTSSFRGPKIRWKSKNRFSAVKNCCVSPKFYPTISTENMSKGTRDQYWHLLWPHRKFGWAGCLLTASGGG